MQRPAQKDKGQDVLRKKLGGLDRRRFHGCNRVLHPLVQRTTDQGFIERNESAGTQEITGIGSIGRYGKRQLLHRL